MSQNFIMKIPWRPPYQYKKLVLFFVSMVLFLPRNCYPVELNQIDQTQNSVDKKLLNEFDESLKNSEECPLMIPKYFANVQPKAGFDKQQITYHKKPVQTKEQCVQLCCNLKDCNIVFMYKENNQLTCFHANCTQDEFCLPVTPNTTNVANKLKNKSLMVLVRPMNGKSWPDLPKTDTVQSLENVQKQSFQKRSHLGEVCELNMRQCGENEICQKPPKSKRRDGICQCQDGFVKNAESGFCDLQSRPKST